MKKTAHAASAGRSSKVRPQTSHLTVLAPFSDVIVGRFPREKVRSMIAMGSAWNDGGRVRLIGIGQEHPCVVRGGFMTRTGRGPFMGAIGRSQCYTTDNAIRRVDGFKHIDPADRHVFIASVTREPV